MKAITAKILPLVFSAIVSVSFAAPKVVTDIAPVAMLVEAVSGEEVALVMVSAGASPHHYQLRPSEARRLQDADLVFYVGEALTPWIEKPLASLTRGATISLTDQTPPELLLAAVEEEQDEHGHGDDDIDPHLWLDPEIARAWTRVIKDALIKADPASAPRYEANAQALLAELEGLEVALHERFDVAPLYVAAHDSLGYFERRFNLSPLGFVSASDASAPSAARLHALEALGARAACGLYERGSNPQTLRNLLPDLPLVEIDIFGKAGQSYSELIGALADQIASCGD